MAANRRRWPITPWWRLLIRGIARRRLDVEYELVRYRFDPVSSRRLRNWFLTGISAQLRLPRPLGLPTYLQVEPTNHCNLRCPLCPTTNGEMSRPMGAMDPVSFEKLMSDAGESLLLLALFAWGEPFLHENLCDLIASAKKRGVKVITSTNGHFIADSTAAREVVDSGLDTLIFAVDGASATTYQVFRRGGNFERVLDSIRLMAEAKKAAGSDTPLLNFQFVVMRHNETQMAEAVDVARRLGADMVAFKTANLVYPYDEGSGDICPPDDPEYRRYEYVENTHIRVRKPNRCVRMWNHPAVQWDGSVATCDCDVNGEFELGNAFRSSFREIWWGERFVSARKAFARGRPVTRFCTECTCNFRNLQDNVASVIPLTSAAHRAGVRSG